MLCILLLNTIFFDRLMQSLENRFSLWCFIPHTAIVVICSTSFAQLGIQSVQRFFQHRKLILEEQ